MSARRFGATCVAVLISLAGATSDSAAVRIPSSIHVTGTAPQGGSGGRVDIELLFRSATRGTFTARGAIADTGSFKAIREITGGRLRLTEILAGRTGTIRVGVVRSCAGGAGTWRVLSGVRAYKGLRGGGTARGGPGCTAEPHPRRAVLSGIVSTPPAPPPPPIARPGHYAGATSQRHEIVFEVQDGGRTLAGLIIRSVEGTCTKPNVRMSGRISMPGPHQITDDGSFTLESGPTERSTVKIGGRFSSPTSAAGTASVSQTQTDPTTNTQYSCSASISWTATLPPPSAPPGTYCGFTLQGPGICFEVAGSGREVTRFESAVVVRCFPGGAPPTLIDIELTFEGSIPIGGHLGFSKGGISFEGLVSGTGGITGLIEAGGTASGTVSLGPVTLDHEGTRYSCHSGFGKWDARR